MAQDIKAIYADDPGLQQVISDIENYEDWVERDPSTLAAMDQSIKAVLGELDRNRLQVDKVSDDKASDLIECVLLVLGSMPVDKALACLQDFQRYEQFFGWISQKLHSNPPLRSYAKTLLGRAHVLQQRAVHKAINSENNFRAVLQALETIKHDR